MRTIAKKSLEGVKNKMKEHIHSRIAKILVVLALAVVASVMFVFVGCNNECAHENTHNEVVAAATCTTEGITRTVCDDCGHVTESKTAALGHDWDEGTVVAATCTAGGYTLQTCSRCTAQRQVEPTEPTGHTWDEGKVVAATCTAGGYTLQTCTACGAQQQVNPTEPTGHNYAIDESKTVAGTCLTNGSVTYVCANCGDTYTEQTALGQHKYEKVTVASTCTTAGYTVEVCSVCGHESNRTALPLVAHEYETVTVASTCTTAGYTAEVCSVCGAERNRVNLSLAAHSWKDDTEHSYAATCTVDGVDIEYCENCGITREYTLKATGHKWGETEVVAPTCTANGYSTHTCTVCKYEERYNTTQALGHDFDDDNVKIHEATCTELGYYYTVCTRCDEFNNLNTIPAKGHTFVYDAEDTVITAPTCTTDGKMTGHCEDCGIEFSYTGTQLSEMVKNYATEAAFVEALKLGDIFEEEEYNLENADTEEGDFTFLVAPGHDYVSDNEFACVDMDPTDALYAKYKTSKDSAGKYNRLWNYCERCEKEFALQDHTQPAGTIPCTAIANNPNFDEDDFTDENGDDIAGLDRDEHAYVCTVCEQPIEKVDHNYQTSVLVSGNPVLAGGYDDCVFKPVEGVTTLTCEYYLVCTYCNEVKIAAPHTYPSEGDDEYQTCAHGDLCTVCGLEISLPIGHDAKGKVTAENGVTFGDFAYVAPTCTTDGYTYEFCSMCAEREEAGEEVVWTEKTATNPKGNYTAVPVAKYNHNDWTKEVEEGAELPDDWTKEDIGFYTVTVSLKGDEYAINCLDGYQDRDYCQLCDDFRVSQRPTFYSDVACRNAITTEDAFDKAVTVYVKGANGMGVVYEGSWTAPRGGRPYTDADGNYNIIEPGNHKFELLAFDDYDVNDRDDVVLPTCDNDVAHVLYRCEVCGTDGWHDVKLGDYVVDAGYAVSDLPGDVEAGIAAYIADRKEVNAWHTGEMVLCGHDYCSDCVVGNHNAQYWINFEIVEDCLDEGGFALAPVGFYSCRGESTDPGSGKDTNTLNFYEVYAYVSKFVDDNSADGIYLVQMFTDKECKTPVEWKDFVVATDGNGAQQFMNKTVYITRTYLDPNKTNNYFDTTFNQNSSWYNGGEGHEGMTLDVEFKFNNTIINYETITSIKVTVKSNTGALYAQAVSSGANLTNLLKNAMISWDADKDGELDKPEELWLSIGWFCESADMDTDPEGNWLFTYGEGFENNIDLDNYVVTIEITTSVDEEPWTSTQTIANNNIVETQP